MRPRMEYFHAHHEELTVWLLTVLMVLLTGGTFLLLWLRANQ